MPDQPADHAADNHATGAVIVAVSCRARYLLVPALTARLLDTHGADDGLDVDHAGTVGKRGRVPPSMRTFGPGASKRAVAPIE